MSTKNFITNFLNSINRYFLWRWYWIAWFSWFYVVSVFDTGRISPVLRLPIYVTLVWLPIGFVITGIQYVLTALANLTRPEIYLSVSVVDSYEDTETQI